MDKIEKCPCCGKRAEGEWFSTNIRGENKFHVFCTNWKCGIKTKPCDSEKEALGIWNVRAHLKEK